MKFFSCPARRADELDESLQSILGEQGIHKNLIAKKFHITRDETLVIIFLTRNAIFS